MSGGRGLQGCARLLRAPTRPAVEHPAAARRRPHPARTHPPVMCTMCCVVLLVQGSAGHQEACARGGCWVRLGSAAPAPVGGAAERGVVRALLAPRCAHGRAEEVNRRLDQCICSQHRSKQQARVLGLAGNGSSKRYGEGARTSGELGGELALDALPLAPGRGPGAAPAAWRAVLPPRWRLP